MLVFVYMIVVSWKNPELIVDNVIFMVIITVPIIMAVLWIKKTYEDFLTADAENSKFSPEKTFAKVKIPIIAVAKSGKVVWANDAFDNTIKARKLIINKNIKNILDNFDLNEIMRKNRIDYSLEDSTFTCLACKLSGVIIIHFIDDTYYKKISKKYLETRAAVATIVLDNKEELLKNCEDFESTQIVANIENLLQKWAANTGGFFKKISDDRYLFVTEEQYLRAFEENNFEILNKIHSIKRNDGTFATISIGIGRSAESLKIAELWSKKALSMALGRGGDQVAIKDPDGYKFFGGTSKELYNTSAVRARVIASILNEQMAFCTKVLIMGHKFSDLDCIGASVALQHTIEKVFQKESYIVVKRSESLSETLISNIEISSDKKIFLEPEQALKIADEKTLLIIVDTHIPDFVESVELYKKSNKIFIIDHHRMMVNYIKNAQVFYHEPSTSSTSEMVGELVQYIGDGSIDKISAEALLAGIMLDTKNFVLRTSANTFKIAAFLRDNGADTVEVRRLFSNSLGEYKIRFDIVSHAEVFNNCAIACTDELNDDMRAIASQAADELLSIQGVKASFVLSSLAENKGINISARSYGSINVQLIMEALGGGGHQNMAAVQLYGINMDSARRKLMEVITASMHEFQ